MDKLFFLHIPKTGGSSLIKYLKDNIFIGRSSGEINTIIEDFNLEYFLKFDFIGGHIDFVDVVELYKDYSFVTIFRNPVDKCISWYKFSKVIGGKGIIGDACVANNGIRLEDLHSSKNTLNLQYVHNQTCWMLGDHVRIERRTLSIEDCFENAKNNINKFKDIIFYEDFKNNLDSFLKKYNFGSNNSFPWIHKTQNIEVSKESIDSLKKCNMYDIKLYEYARGLFYE